MPLPQMPLGVNLPVITYKETPAPAQVMEEIPLHKAENSIDTKRDNMNKVFKAGTLKLIESNEAQYRGSQASMAYTIQADYPPPYIPMNFHPPNAPMGPAFYPHVPNYQQHPWQALGSRFYYNKLGYIPKFCPDVCTDHENGIALLNHCGILTLGPRRGNAGEISGD